MPVRGDSPAEVRCTEGAHHSHKFLAAINESVRNVQEQLDTLASCRTSTTRDPTTHNAGEDSRRISRRICALRSSKNKQWERRRTALAVPATLSARWTQKSSCQLPDNFRASFARRQCTTSTPTHAMINAEPVRRTSRCVLELGPAASSTNTNTCAC